MLIDLIILTDWATRTHIIAIVLVRDIQPGDREGHIVEMTKLTSTKINRTSIHREGDEGKGVVQIQVAIPARVYEGKTDPMDHLNLYKNLMMLKGYSDEVMCKAFLATLKGSARSWFRKLPLRTIDSFNDLGRLFVSYFMSYRAVLDVKDPSDKVVVMVMMEGLRPGLLFDSLSKSVCAILSVLQSKVDKYIAAKEFAEAKRRR
ncbi:hypothetical protein Acr_00g0037030 [Actinidia rufa]|uniref:Retrotransposon gag domain-containing protein n=1 Tax=Actinidia rufa TaxID=165716 RepID=A0A7J0DIM8_9ERIC|nr:hypothetical protein Acr_00g0037030 [Actinidia rufa]